MHIIDCLEKLKNDIDYEGDSITELYSLVNNHLAKLAKNGEYINVTINHLSNFEGRDILYPNKEDTVIFFFHNDLHEIDELQEMVQVIIFTDGWAANICHPEHTFPVYKDDYNFYELNIKTGNIKTLDLSNISPKF